MFLALARCYVVLCSVLSVEYMDRYQIAFSFFCFVVIFEGMGCRLGWVGLGR